MGAMQGLNPRFATGYSLGLYFPEWMERNLAEVRIPLLILHGTMDKVTDPEMSKRLVANASSQDKALKHIEGAYHCETILCSPGVSELTGMEWLPEQVETTDQT